ncbi:MAG: MlaD family protein [Maricaulaceae bacterium]
MKRANTKIIGIFVFGALLLMIGSIFLFGSRDIFQKKRYFYAYFEQDVSGVDIGAPMKFSGIEVGSVKEIVGIYDPETSAVRPRLLLEFHPETLKGAKVAKGEYTLFQPLLKQGMRASLKSQSFLTGQLYLSLDFYDNRAIRTLGTDKDKYPEMPTIDSGLGEIFKAFQDLPLDALVVQLTNTLDSLDNVLANEGISESASYLPTLLADADLMLKAIGMFTTDDLPLTAAQLRATLKTGDTSISALTDKLSNETLVTLDQSMKTLTEQLSQETLVNLSSTMRQFDVTMGQLESTLSTAQTQLDPNSPISTELTTMLREMKLTAEQLRTFTRYLESNPEALLRGR